MKQFQILNLAITLLLICSCSSNDDNETTTSHIIGEWEAVDECLNDTCYGIGVTYDYLTFNSNGTAVEGRDNPNNNLILSYAIENKEMTITQDEGNGSSYTTYNRIITLTATELIFEAYADDDGNFTDIEKYYFVKTDN